MRGIDRGRLFTVACWGLETEAKMATLIGKEGGKGSVLVAFYHSGQFLGEFFGFFLFDESVR